MFVDHRARINRQARVVSLLACLTHDNADLAHFSNELRQAYGAKQVVILVTETFAEHCNVLAAASASTHPLGEKEPSCTNVHDWLEAAEGLGRPVAIERRIDDRRRLVVGVFFDADGESQPDLDATLDTVADFLAASVRVLLEWTSAGARVDKRFAALTPVEWETLRGLETPDSEKILADRLCRSAHTVHTHIKSVYRKLGVRTRIEAIMHTRELRRKLLTTHNW